MRIKRPTVGRRETEGFHLLLFHQPCSFTYVSFFFPSSFLGKVNLFIQSQQGDLDTPTQLRSLSTHPCQGELSIRKYTHAHTQLHVFYWRWWQSTVNTHTLAHTHPETLRSNFSLKEKSFHSPSLCSKGQFSRVGLQRACSNINYIYNFLMRPLKNIYPRHMSSCSEMSGGMSLLWVGTATQINKHGNTLKGARWCKAGPWHLARASICHIRVQFGLWYGHYCTHGGCMCNCCHLLCVYLSLLVFTTATIPLRGLNLGYWWYKWLKGLKFVGLQGPDCSHTKKTNASLLHLCLLLHLLLLLCHVGLQG